MTGLFDTPKSDKKLLALDVATTTGFCCATTFGHWDLSNKKDESKSMRLIRFKSKLKDIIKAEDIKIIVFERVAGYHKNAIIVAAELIGVLKVFCEENNIDYRAYSASEIKKFATGNGNASKDLMLEASQKFRVGVSTYDEADAVLLYELAISDLSL